MHRIGNFHLDWRKVPYALYPCFYQLIRYALGKSCRHRYDANLDITLFDHLLHIADIFYHNMIDRFANDLWVLVKQSHQIEAKTYKILVVRQGLAKMTDANHGNIPVIVQA